MCIFILLLFLTICMCCVYLDLRIVGLRRVCSTTLRYATYPTRFAIRDSSIAFENFFGLFASLSRNDNIHLRIGHTQWEQAHRSKKRQSPNGVY